jgi:hypothetical protein
VLFLGIPWRVNTNALSQYDEDPKSIHESVQYQLAAWCAPGWHPFATAINMSDWTTNLPVVYSTNACVGYINKLASMGASNSPAKLILSASGVGYGNRRYYFDDARAAYLSPGFDVASEAVAGVLAANPVALVVYTNGNDYGTNLGLHITNGVDVAGYLSWGAHSALHNQYARDSNLLRWQGSSGWWIIETIESHNGLPREGQGDYWMWFCSNAFAGTNYSNTPIGAVTHVDEPSSGWNDPYRYFGLWEGGRNFAICAWNSQLTPYFQAVGDSLVTK